MKKGFEIFEIGNRIWQGRIIVDIDKKGDPVYRHFYGLSEESVKDQMDKYIRDPKAAEFSEIVKRKEKNTLRKRNKPKKKGVKLVPLSGGISGASGTTIKASEADQRQKRAPGSVRIADIMVVKHKEAEHGETLSSDAADNIIDISHVPKEQSSISPNGSEDLIDFKVRDMCNKWLLNRAVSGIAKSTFDNDRNICRIHILPVMGNVYCNDINERGIEHLVMHMIRKGNSASMKNGIVSKNAAVRYMTAVNSILEFGFKKGYIPDMFKVYIDIHDIQNEEL